MKNMTQKLMKVALYIMVISIFAGCSDFRKVPKMQVMCQQDADCLEKGGIRYACFGVCSSNGIKCETDTDCPNSQTCKQQLSDTKRCVIDTSCKNSSDCNKDAANGSKASKCLRDLCVQQLCTAKDTDECKISNAPASCFSCPTDQKCQLTNSDGKRITSPYCVMDKPTTQKCTEGKTKPCYTGKEGTKDIGICKAGTYTCTNGKWETECKNEVTPKTEICNDDKDNNCDGNINEESVCGKKDCEDGKTRPCYSGKDGTEGIGLCKAGKQTCKNGQWEKTCEGEVLPSSEVCDKQDNDCNGKTDDAKKCQPQPDCEPGKTRECYSGPDGTAGTASCKKGTQTCSTLKKWGECKGEVTPSKEICDGEDNDCNGKTDELPECKTGCTDGKTKPCYTGPKGTEGKGMCKAGKQTCKSKKWGECQGEVKPSKELCDNQDNNCDGNVDENITRDCYSGNRKEIGVGVCKTGKQACNKGQWEQTCKGEVTPPAQGKDQDPCDGKDNDCNGIVDDIHTTVGDDCTATLPNGCRTPGKVVCTSDGSGVRCKSTDPNRVKLPEEKCNNGKDDDCNGKIDDGPKCNPVCTGTQTQSCYPQGTKGCTKVNGKWECKGQCKTGTQTCKGGAWSTCEKSVTPSKEVCDDIDNNCDGKKDETFKDLNKSCDNGQKGTCKITGKFVCSSDKSKTECDAKPKPTSAETCNGQDDNCDGQVDEGTDKPCKTACSSGKEVCKNGSYEPCNAPKPAQETCNGKDDDCDGNIDEGMESTCIEFKVIKMKGVKTKLGSSPGEKGHTTDGSQFKRNASWDYDLHFAKIETNKTLYTLYMKTLPPNQIKTDCTTHCPVNNVLWDEAALFSNLYNKAQGYAECYTCTTTSGITSCTIKNPTKPHLCKGWRLPTQNEAEYASRGGRTDEFPCGTLMTCARYSFNSNSKVHKSCSLQANGYGLCDMAGNLSEWCSDGYQKAPPFGLNAHENTFQSTTRKTRVFRGCDLTSTEAQCHVAKRLPAFTVGSGIRRQSIGFRLVRTAP